MQHQPARERVVAMCRALLERGFLKATEGNLSVRVPGHDLLAITPSNYDYNKLRPQDIAILDLDGKVVDAELKPSIEAGFHSSIYRLRPDVNAVIHTHQPFASALALTRTRIPALFDEQVRFLGRSVEIVDYAPSGTSFLSKNVQKRVTSGDNAFILANHGVLVLGTDADRAVFNMALLEKVAVAQLLAMCGGEQIHQVPAPIREVAFSKLRSEERKIAKQVTEATPLVEAGTLVDSHLPAHLASGQDDQDETEPYAAPDAELDRSTPATTPAGAGTMGEEGGEVRERSAYAISSWPDADAINRRLAALVAQPMRPVKRDVMIDVLEWFDEHCPKSKALTKEAMDVIPGGVQHNLAFNYPFPLAVDRAEGAHLWDRDGNRYIDFLQAGGPTILGSNYAPVREKVEEAVRESGPVTGLFHEYELKLAESICRHVPSVEMFRMLGSGTEGVMAAVRGARAFTGKRWVIKVGGAYHGWSDSMVYSLRVPGTKRMNAKGIPLGATSATEEFFPHDIGDLRRKLIAFRALGGTAAVIVEPVGPESGTRPVPYDFNAQVRELCDEFGALLIFDEVVTGFRMGMGGAQGYFGVKPDLTVFGKAIAGGYPMAGGVGGRRDIMQVFGAGLGGKHGAHVQVGGTLSANPLSCVAGYYALEEMERTGAAVKAGLAGDRLTAGLQDIIGRYGLPFVAYNQGSIVHLETSGVMLLSFRHPLRLLKENGPRKQMMEEMGAAYTANGIITLAGSRMYTSMATTDDVVDEALAGFERVLSQVEGL